ncbi:MAG: hypothetical protein V4730_11655 [Pseudomonadota bacterium]
MAFEEFKGELDAPANGGFAPFSGELDAPTKSEAGATRSEPVYDPVSGAQIGTNEVPVDTAPAKGSGLGEELGNLRDSFFTGVDNTRASAKTVNMGMVANRLKNTTQRLQELEARGQGDSTTARQMRNEIASAKGQLPAVIGEMTEAQGDAQRGAALSTRPAVAKVNAAKTFGEAWEAFKEAPYDVIAGVTATSLPSTLPALVAAAVMGPGAGAMAMGANSAVVEGGSSLADFARDAGVDVTNGKAVEAFFTNPQNLSAAMTYAGKRAGIIGSLDAVSGGLAGKTIAPAMKSKIARQAVNLPTQMVAQAGLGAGGEALGQLATKGEIDQPGQVLMEAAGELGGAPMEVAAFSKEARDAMRQTPPGPTPQPPPAPRVDPIAEIGKAQNVDQAIAAAARATQSSTAVDNIGAILKANQPATSPENPDVSLPAAIQPLAAGATGSGMAEPASSLETPLGTERVDAGALDAGSIRDQADGGAVPLGAQPDAVDPLVPVSQRQNAAQNIPEIIPATPDVQNQPAPGATAQSETAPAETPKAGEVAGVQPTAAGSPAGTGGVQAAGVAGQQIDKDWAAFAPDSGTLNIPRADMPQIKAEHRGAMVNFLNARDIAHTQEEVPATSLKPTQTEFSPAKVAKAMGFTGTDRSILVSSDNHVLDGHHQWMAKLEAGEPVKVIRLNAPIQQLLETVKEFPSAETAAGTAQPAPQRSARQVAIDAERARIEAKRAEKKAAKAEAGKAPEGLSVGTMPNTAEPVTIKDGVVYVGKYPGTNYETGDDVTVPAGATGEQIRDALKAAGALGKKARVFGLSKEPAGQATPANIATETVATETPDPVQQRAEFAAAEKKRKAPGNAARERTNTANPFKGFLGKHGISNSLAAEFAPGRKERQAAMVQGYGPIFRKSGPQLDALAARAVEEGFLLEPDEAKLQALILDALRGKRIIAQYAEGVAEDEMQDRMAAYEEAARQLPDDVLEALDGDIPAFDSASSTSTEDAMRALGFTDQEINDAIANESQSQSQGSESRGQSDEGSTGPAQSRGEGGNAAPRDDAEGLTSPTPADVLAQQKRTADGNKAETKAATAAENKAKADAEVKGFTLTGSDRGADADPNQGAMFSRAAPEAASAAERATDILDAAAITGKDRLEALRDVRAGLITPEELEAAYPATVEQTETPAFKKWFGPSVVTKNGKAGGKPLRMFHGTADDFNSFEPTNSKHREDGSLSQTKAIFVTSDPAVANEYATQYQKGSAAGGNVMPVYVKAHSPFDFEKAAQRAALVDEIFRAGDVGKLGDGQEALKFDGRQTLYTKDVLNEGLASKESNWTLMERPDVQGAIKTLGHDGFYVAENGKKNLGVYAPEQLKSAIGNNGNFDPADARIQFSRADAGDLNPADVLTQTDDLFALPRSEATSVEDITAENDANIKVEKSTNATGRTEYKFTMPDGKTATMAVRPFNKYATEEAPTIYGFDMKDGEMTALVTERPGENADEVYGMDDVWIDVSRLKTAGDGAKIYNIAATYAHNNGKIFIGDPAGLSDEALRRRTEQMISSALKFGTTEHLGPHPRQATGDRKLGVPPLKWDYADPEGNFERMVDVSVKSMENGFPGAKLVGYKDGTFYRTDKNQRFRDRGQLARLVGSNLDERRSVPGSTAEAGQAGWRTVARNALFRNLQEAHNADGGRGRRSLLDRVRDEFPRLRSDPDSSGAIAPEGRIFYSEGNAAPAVRNPSTVERVQAAVTELIGGKQLPNKLGRVVATTASEIKSYWEPQLGQSVQLGSEGEAGQAQAFYDPRTKTVFLIADQIPAGDETAIAAHELMHKHGVPVLGKDGWEKLHTTINGWANAEEGSDERAVYNYASRRVRAVGEELSSQEMFPYAVEAAIKMGVKPSLIAKKGTVARWLGSVKYAMQQAWSKVTGRPETFKTQDLIDLAFGIAQMENPESAAAMGRITDAPVKTDSPEFERWFGDSKVVDDAGKPLVVYHGSPNAGIKTFDSKHEGSNTGAADDQHGLGGFYFTDDPKVADTYARTTDVEMANTAEQEFGIKPRAELPESTTYPVYLSLQNPLRVNGIVTREVLKKAEKGGHDGVIASIGSQTEYVAFRPEQIKSAIGNNGNFDGANPDIRFSRTATQTGTPAAPAKPALNPWRDETGRMQFAPGQWLYDKLGKAAGPLLVRLGMKAATPELRRQLRQMKIDVEKAQEVSVAIARETSKLSEEERAMVSDLVEQELKVGVIPPAHAVKLAAMINDAMGRQTDELVSLGMLTKDSADKWRGKYLPRYYESKLKDKLAKTGATWADALMGLTGRQSVMKGIKGKNLKGRGLYETIPEAELPNYEALGWEVRDPDYTPSLPSVDGTVQVWRDFSPAEREKMGEIRDAGFRFVMGYMQSQRDIALGRMFERMAQDPEQSSRLEKDGYVQVPTTVVSGTGAKVYGKLAGRWVPTETLSQLSNIEENTSAAWQMYRKAMGIWKMGKVAMNPVSHVNNIVSNLTMAHLAGVSYHRGDKYIAAARDLIKKPAMLQEAKDNGLFLGTVSDAELMNSMPEELRILAQRQESTTLKVARTGFDIMTFFLRKPMGAAYQAEDTFFRYLIYKDARERGVEPQDAVDYAQRYIFTYDDLPKGARRIRDFGVPFFSYTYKAVPALLHTALTHPLRMAAPAAVLWGINAAAYAIATGDDDDEFTETLKKYLTNPEFRAQAREKEKLEREHLPPWNKGTTALMTPKMIRLGQDEVTKLPLFIDVSRIIPGGDMFDVSPNAGGIPLPQPITPSHPLFTTAVAMLGNKDLFRGKELVDKNDTRGEATEKRLDWLWTQLSPAVAAGNYHWQKGMNALAQASGSEVRWTAALPDSVEDKIPEAIAKTYTGIDKSGQPVQPKHAAMQTFGIKVRPIDLDTAKAIDKSMQNKMARDIDTELKALQRLNSKGAVSDRVYDKAKDLAREKKDRLKDGKTVDGDERD